MPTKIEWCDETINPIVGCSKISDGCQNCYAEKMAWRLKCMGVPKYQDVVDKNGWTGKIGVDMSVFDKLPKTPKKIFVSSMGDLFHENVTDKQLDSIFANIAYDAFYPISALFNKQPHTYLLLTKRPERIANSPHPEHFARWTNIWLGVTAENQKRADERIPTLLQIPAAVRFVSIEPMLEPVDLDDFWGAPGVGLDWVIVGPETGPGKRECKPEWIRDLYEQCQESGVPFFDKTKTNWIARESPNTKSQ